MPRRREIPKRDVAPDPLYDSQLVSKFINCVMSDGKRSTAERILYKSFDIIKEKTGDDPLKVFKKAIDNVTRQYISLMTPTEVRWKVRVLQQVEK